MNDSKIHEVVQCINHFKNADQAKTMTLTLNVLSVSNS